MTTVPAFRLGCARRCSSRSCGSTTRATRMKAERDLGSRLPAISPARMVARSRSATARWAACVPQCGSLSSIYRTVTVAAAAPSLLLRDQTLQLFGVLDVELEAARHHDIAGLLIGFAR